MVELTGDRFDPAIDDYGHWTINGPSLADLDQAIDRLDAEEFTLLSINPAGEECPHLMVGGGAGRYVVHATYDNLEFFSVFRREDVEGRSLLCAGGQEGDFPSVQVVDKADAVCAARCFLVSGELEPSLRWVKRG